MKNSKIYMIIVTYNAMQWAERCFSSLQKSHIPLQIIVVDNGSTDGSQDFIKTQFPEVAFIQSAENLGFGKANNIGIEKAYKNGADFFYLMNQDAWIYEDSIQELLNVYKSYPETNEIGILSPMHLDGTEKKLDLFLDKYISQNFESRIISDFYMNAVQNYYPINFINAAHWFIPKETIEKVGGFNPYFFHYGEDNEYVNRLTFHGKKIILCPKSKVVHDGKQELGKVDYRRFSETSIDIKILNPNLKNNLQVEKRALLQSILKNIFFRNFKEVRKLQKTYSRIKKNSKTLEELKKTLSTKAHAFLKIGY